MQNCSPWRRLSFSLNKKTQCKIKDLRVDVQHVGNPVLSVPVSTGYLAQDRNQPIL